MTSVDYELRRNKTAHRRLVDSADPEALVRIRKEGEGAEPLLAAIGRLTMIWNNVDTNIRWTLARRVGLTFEEWMAGGTAQLLDKMRAVDVPGHLEPAWNHMIESFDELRHYRNHFTHGVSATWVSDSHHVMEAYLIKTFAKPTYEEVIETIYKEDLEELAALLWTFGGFAGEVLAVLQGYREEAPALPPLPPRYRRRMRDSEEMRRYWAKITGEPK